MPSTRLLSTKAGKAYYEIRVRLGRGCPELTTRWYVPSGWSQRAIDRELAKVAAEFERRCKAGEVVTRKERKAHTEAEAAEAAKILTVKQYGERVFMPAKKVILSENTRDSYQRCLDRWIYPRIGATKITEVSPADLSAVILALQSEGKAHSSAVKCYAILHSIFKMAYLSDTIDRNPMDKVERPKPRKDEIKDDEADACTVAEVRYIMRCLDKEPLKWQAYVRLLIDTGIRRGEACGLQWRNVDFKTEQITIAGNLCYTASAGVYLDTPKSRRKRTIDVDPAVMALLKALQQEQASKAISQFVFTQEGSNEPMHPQSPSRYFKKFAERYGIPGLHPHKLRHSFASIAITNGADVASVSQNLGHADKSTTLRMYTHADQESMRRASNIFRDALKEKPSKKNRKRKRA